MVRPSDPSGSGPWERPLLRALPAVRASGLPAVGRRSPGPRWPRGGEKRPLGRAGRPAAITSLHGVFSISWWRFGPGIRLPPHLLSASACLHPLLYPPTSGRTCGSQPVSMGASKEEPPPGADPALAQLRGAHLRSAPLRPRSPHLGDPVPFSPLISALPSKPGGASITHQTWTRNH